MEPMHHKKKALKLQQEIPYDTTKIPFAKIKLKKKKEHQVRSQEACIEIPSSPLLSWVTLDNLLRLGFLFSL